MAPRKLSIGDDIIARAGLSAIIDKAAEGQSASVDADKMARDILAFAADVHYKPVSGALNIAFDLSVSVSELAARVSGDAPQV